MARPRDIDRKVKVRNLEGKEEEVTVGEACVMARKLGAPLSDCATFAGISAAALHKWMARGRKYKTEDEGDGAADVPEGEGVFVEFVQQMEEADGSGIVKLLALLMQRAEQGDTRALIFSLERKRPAEFGKTIKAELSGRVDTGKVERMSDGELDDQLAGVDVPGD